MVTTRATHLPGDVACENGAVTEAAVGCEESGCEHRSIAMGNMNDLVWLLQCLDLW